MSPNPFHVTALDGPKLSALIVNYDSGAFAETCVRSLRREWRAAAYEPRRLEVVVVDNASPSDQSRSLRALAADGARVIESTENLGYAGGIQRALAESSGEPDDVVCILNPDVVFLEGSVRVLLRHLIGRAGCGAVAPRAFLDEGCAFQLPPVPLPTAREETLSVLEARAPRLARARAGARSERARARWAAELPQLADMLSGACLFLSRAVAEELDPLLDPAYPLYYEDADLCRRLSRMGLDLVWHPRARILHHWSRSAGSGERFEGEPRRRWRVSRARYLAEHAAPLGRLALRAAERACAGRAPRPIHAFDDLGELSRAPELVLEGDERLVLELAPTPNFALAAGAFADPGPWPFPPSAWPWLFAGRYWLRAVETATGRVRGAWTFAKTSAARTSPVEGPTCLATTAYVRGVAS